jgi:hypothetical protein
MRPRIIAIEFWTVTACRSAGLAALVALPAVAAPIHVANNGTDAVKCGTAAAPCRTIGRALLAAPPGGVVEVQPGIYGDVNEDGEADGTGEDETAVGGNMLLLDQSVTVRSTAGPAATVIRCPSNLSIAIEGTTATLGDKINGFTLLDCTVRVDPGEGIAATVAGNRLIGKGVGTGIEVFSGTGVQVANNHCIGFTEGIVFSGTIRAVAVGNTVAGNSTGIRDSGEGTHLRRNLVIGNGIAGLDLQGILDATTDTPAIVEENSVIGNAASAIPAARGGIIVSGLDADDIDINNNNIFGNTAPDENCGIRDESSDDSATLDATGNFWGATTGPGPHPADLTCGLAGTIDTSSFLTAPAKIKIKSMK